MPVSTAGDNEAERRARRESFQRASTSRNSNPPTLRKSFINKQYERCKMLYIENKITIKNAWDVPIIDILHEICDPNRPNFLRDASTSIYIASKVYSLRVDYVHSEGMKLAKNIAKITANDADRDQGEAEQGEGNNESKSKKKKAKRRYANGVKSTIAADPKTLLSPYPKLEPLDFLQEQGVDLESGQISGLLTCKLKEDNTTFLTLNREKLLFPDNDELPLKNIPMKNVNLLSVNSSIKFLGALQDFRIGHHKELGLSEMSAQRLILDDDGIPMHDSDDAILDRFFEDVVNNNVEMEKAQPEYITNFYQNFAKNESEYNFKPIVLSSSGLVIDRLWAGPSHWKLKGIKRAADRFTGAAPAPKRPKRLRKSDVGPIENFDNFNFDEIYPEKPGSESKLVKKRKGVDPNLLLLPLPDLSLAKLVENYDTLFCKPGVKVTRLIHEDQVQEAINDRNNSGSSDGGDCLQNNYSNQTHDHEEIEVLRHGQDYNAENLVDMPTTMPILSLNRKANYANYTNFNKLKNMIWKELSGLDADNSQVEQLTKPIQPTTFLEVYRMVIEREKEKSPSPHVTFNAILHLANEKGLQLDAEPDFKNFVIKRPQLSCDKVV